MGLKSLCLCDKNGRKMKVSGKKVEGKKHCDRLPGSRAAGPDGLREKRRNILVLEKVQKWPSEISQCGQTMGKTVAVSEDCVHPPLVSCSLWFWKCSFLRTKPQWFFQMVFFPYKASIHNTDNSTSSLAVPHTHTEWKTSTDHVPAPEQGVPK